ncbi:hypothetical protein CYLTODRAFT_490427 [Cylindrobasidium torrendii FP15055 ss-10]|uniref:Uncharacterized protein n=1 Tax=Cylindrobasidium torrendii FP15055 ss-10 TaxID=1314674 RepID=A0A0D7BAW1_9AGAR|nr:hypothetical protein CYLTODRAFT_490427 [Cylindrobasidium torrendii FP15055 ss-10]
MTTAVAMSDSPFDMQMYDESYDMEMDAGLDTNWSHEMETDDLYNDNDMDQDGAVQEYEMSDVGTVADYPGDTVDMVEDAPPIAVQAFEFTPVEPTSAHHDPFIQAEPPNAFIPSLPMTPAQPILDVEPQTEMVHVEPAQAEAHSEYPAESLNDDPQSETAIDAPQYASESVAEAPLTESEDPRQADASDMSTEAQQSQADLTTDAQETENYEGQSHVEGVDFPAETTDGQEATYVEDPVPLGVLLSLPGGNLCLFSQPNIASSSSADASELPVLFQDRPTLFRDGLHHVFRALREEAAVAERIDLSAPAQLILDAQELQLTIPEVHEHASAVTIDELTMMHDTLFKSGSLRLTLRTEPNFIWRFSYLQEQVRLRAEGHIGPAEDTTEQQAAAEDPSSEEYAAQAENVEEAQALEAEEDQANRSHDYPPDAHSGYDMHASDAPADVDHTQETETTAASGDVNSIGTDETPVENPADTMHDESEHPQPIQPFAEVDKTEAASTVLEQTQASLDAEAEELAASDETALLQRSASEPALPPVPPSAEALEVSHTAEELPPLPDDEDDYDEEDYSVAELTLNENDKTDIDASEHVAPDGGVATETDSRPEGDTAAQEEQSNDVASPDDTPEEVYEDDYEELYEEDTGAWNEETGEYDAESYQYVEGEPENVDDFETAADHAPEDQYEPVDAFDAVAAPEEDASADVVEEVPAGADLPDAEGLEQWADDYGESTISDGDSEVASPVRLATKRSREEVELEDDYPADLALYGSRPVSPGNKRARVEVEPQTVDVADAE